MPLIKREVEPTELSRGAISQGIRNELECVTNNTLANVVRQVRYYRDLELFVSETYEKTVDIALCGHLFHGLVTTWNLN